MWQTCFPPLSDYYLRRCGAGSPGHSRVAHHFYRYLHLRISMLRSGWNRSDLLFFGYKSAIS